MTLPINKIKWSEILLKNINTILIVITSFLLSSISLSQEKLFIPRNIQTAYQKGTRSPDGKPGAEYWQNSSEYKIKVEVDPATYLVNGCEEVTYYNNSPDTLKRIILRLYPNIFKKGSARDYSMSSEAVNDGVSIKKISIGDSSINLENKSIFMVTSTIAAVNLPKAVPPKSSADFSIEWSFNISSKATLRMGVYDSTTVLVGYWYPQIAVYDDIDGWDYLNYGGQEEFYNDFSNYDVEITLPSNFGVWATGELQNPEEVLTEKIYKRYSAAKESDNVVRIVTTSDLNLAQVYKNDESKNTWNYKASNVTDFAFAFSDQYLWDGLKTVADTSNDKSVFVQAVYPVDSPDFQEVAEICKKLIAYFSYEMPGIKFPFTSFIAFNNGRSGGGMEFPMMINDGSPDILEYTVSLTAHEMAHQYFPFYVGTNEKKYAFMDEGWAVMMIFKYMEKLTGINSRLISNVGNYEFLAGTEEDIPAIINSLSLTYTAYRNSAYDRPSIAYELLRDMIGDEIFLKALQEYIKRWTGKHPTPYDFYFTFNEVTEKNLNWFWNPWFFESGYPDMAIDRVVINNSEAEIRIRKVGDLPTPVRLKVIYENETSEEFYYTAGIWEDGNDIFITKIKLSDILKEIQLGDLIIPDSNRENNLFVVH
jgi:hypothetical protein